MTEETLEGCPLGASTSTMQCEWSLVEKKDTVVNNLGPTAFAGAAIMVATRFSVRIIGLISVTFLARLLTPEDFGLFGTAALTLGLFMLLKQVGFGEAIIKENELAKEHIDTLWTMRLVLSLVIAVIVYLAAPYIAVFLQDTRVENVLRVMALIPVIDSLGSPASPLLLREFRYGTDFLLKSGDKIIRVVAVIIVAYVLRSYWALVIGSLLASSFSVVVTHLIRPYRPRLTLSHLRDHFNFAFWAYLRSVSVFFANASDEFVVRSANNTAFFGIYHIARDLARALIGELIKPVREAMLPALSKMQDDPERLAIAAGNVFGAALIVAVAVSLGVAVTANELVLVLLGEQWVSAAYYLTLLAVGCGCNAVGEINQSTFVAAGLQKKTALFWGVRAVLYAVGCIAAGLLYGPQAVAITFTLLSVAVLGAETAYLLRSVKTPSNMAWPALRPLAAGALMVVVVTNVSLPTSWPLVGLLLAKVFCGAAVYVLTLAGLWKLVGYKDGPEYALYSNLPERLRKLVPLKVPMLN